MKHQIDITTLSRLALLDLDETEKTKLTNSLEEILGFFDDLQSLNTENVEPLFNINEETTFLREDAVKRLVGRDEVLASAPQQSDHCYRINRVLGKES